MAGLALDQIADSLPDAIEVACAALPDDFPPEIRDSIAHGASKRLEVKTVAAP